MAASDVIKRRLSSKPLSVAQYWRCLIILTVFILHGPGMAWSQSILWESHSHGKRLYLMGSIHVLQESHYPLPDVMEKAFQESEIIVFEIDQQEMEEPASQELLLTKGLYKSGETLEQNIKKSTFLTLKNHLVDLNLPLSIFQPMKPAYCALVITMMEFQRLGFEARYGLDHYFANKAQRQGKKIAALESAEFQINLFFDMTSEDQGKFLQQTLLEIDTFAKESNRMARSWEKGESSKLNDLLSTSFNDFPDLYEKMIINRNKAWLPQIEIFSRQHQAVLVVVGAGHLVGPHSLLKLLEERGYTFSQL